MKNYILFFYLLASYFVPIGLSGQSPYAQHFTTADGLPSSLVYRCAEDKDGFIWFVTDRGVAKFDGYTFHRFTREDGLTNNDIWGVRTAEDGRLWFSCFNTPIFYENGKFVTISQPENTKITKVEKYRFDSRGNLYFKDINNQNSITHSSEKGWEIKAVEQPHFLTTDALGKDWFFDLKIREYLKIYEGGDKVNPKFEINLANKSIRHTSFMFVYEVADKVYVTGKKKFIEFDFKSLKIRSWDEILPKGTVVTGVYNFKNDQLLIISSNGNYIVDKHMNISAGFEFLNDYKVNYAFQDSNGNIWICTRDDGIYFLTESASKSKTFRYDNYEESNDFLKLTTDQDSNILIGKGDGGIIQFDNNSLNKHELILPPAQSKRTMGLGITDDNMIWIGGDYGLTSIKYSDLLQKNIEPEPGHRFNSEELKPNILYNCYIKKIVSTGKYIYLGHRSGTNRLRVDGKKIENIAIEKKAMPTYALAATDTSLWIGKKEGIFFWSEKQNQVITLGDKSPVFSLPTNALVTDSGNNLWIGSDGFGVFRYSTDEKMDAISELTNAIPKSLFFDKKTETIWVAHNEGVSRIKTTSNEPFEYEYTLLNKAHGLASLEVNDILKQENNIYIATKNGLTILDNDIVFSKKEKGRLHFSGLLINGISRPLSNTIDLKSHETNVTISFVCLSFQSSGTITYSYKMEGLDKDWRTTTDLKKEYNALPAGKYSFKLKAATGEGLSTPEKVINFRIKAVWWKRWWAVLFAILSFIFLLTFAYKWRVKTIEAKNNAQNEITKKFAELELEALQTQMNPHFIFNALQSIQNFVMQNDVRTANKYMVSFSRLMRLFLESSKQKYITVSEEIQLLKFYVELEHLRFSDKFEYEFIIGDGLEESTSKIASMLIQPFIENAINHGLVQRKKPGKLEINLSQTKNFLNVVIDDNGIGRAAGEKLRRESFKHHTSRGMQLIEGRKKVFNLLNKAKITIKITDKKDSQNLAAGTRVELSLPLKKIRIKQG